MSLLGNETVSLKGLTPIRALKASVRKVGDVIVLCWVNVSFVREIRHRRVFRRNDTIHAWADDLKRVRVEKD